VNAQQRLVVVVAILASFVAFLDGSVVNVALPAISRELGGGLVVQQWVVDAYLITLGALIMLAGSLSDVFGRERMLRLGLVGFGIASLLCTVAPTAEVLIAARALQGVAGALLVPSSLALIVANFDTAGQGKAIGRWTAWTGIAFIAGPVIGGVFVDTLSWRFVFAINVLPIAATLLLMMRLQKRSRPVGGRVDYAGAVLGALGLGGIVFALIEQQQSGWAHPLVWGTALAGLLAALAFVLVERRSRAPMLPLELFRIRNFGIGNVATAFVYAGLAFGPLIVTLFLQQVADYAATAAGLAMIPSTLVMLALSGTFGALAGRYGPRLFMAIGPAVAACGMLWMLTMGGEVDYWVQVLPGVLLLGLGLSITVAPLTAAILGSVPAEQAGIGSAVNNAVSRVAGLVAVACAAIIVGGQLDVGGLHRGLIATAAMMLTGSVVSAIGIQNPVDVTRAEPAPS
jgi:EmrB/QacA subfamily drug resistance transporter